MEGANIKGANLTNTNLKFASLEGANLGAAYPNGSHNAGRFSSQMILISQVKDVISQ